MEEFWKFIFGQSMLPAPKDDAAQIKRDADLKLRGIEEHMRAVPDEVATQRAEAAAAHKQRMDALAHFNAYLDSVEAEREASPPSVKVRRPGQNITFENLPPMKPEPKNWLNERPYERSTILPPSYYTERGMPVPPNARALPAELASTGRRSQGGPQ